MKGSLLERNAEAGGEAAVVLRGCQSCVRAP